jgi:hypothetical protein
MENVNTRVQPLLEESRHNDSETNRIAINELTKQCADLKSWVRHLEQEVNELKRKQR